MPFTHEDAAKLHTLLGHYFASAVDLGRATTALELRRRGETWRGREQDLERQVEVWTRQHTKDTEAVEAQMRAMLGGAQAG